MAQWGGIAGAYTSREGASPNLMKYISLERERWKVGSWWGCWSGRPEARPWGGQEEFLKAWGSGAAPQSWLPCSCFLVAACRCTISDSRPVGPSKTSSGMRASAISTRKRCSGIRGLVAAARARSTAVSSTAWPNSAMPSSRRSRVPGSGRIGGDSVVKGCRGPRGMRSACGPWC